MNACEVAVALRALPLRPMDDELSRSFLMLTMFDLDCRSGAVSVNDMVTITEEVNTHPLVAIVRNRLLIGLPQELLPSPAVWTFLSELSGGAPGTMVLLATVPFEFARTNGKSMSMEDLARTFAIGFPDEEGFSAVWESQKKEDAVNSNSLDNLESWS